MFWESSVEHKERGVLFATYTIATFVLTFYNTIPTIILLFTIWECLCSTRVHVSRIVTKSRCLLIACHWFIAISSRCCFWTASNSPTGLLCDTSPQTRKEGWRALSRHKKKKGGQKMLKKNGRSYAPCLSCKTSNKWRNIWDVVTSSRTKTFWWWKEKRTLQTVLGRLEHLFNPNKTETGRLDCFL